MDISARSTRSHAGWARAARPGASASAMRPATSAGLAVILAASAPLFLAVRLAGAAYLIYLGARSLLTAMARTDATHVVNPPASRLSTRAAFAQGFVSNLSNAKMVAFFISLLPPFAGPHPSFILLLALGLNFCLLTLAWLVGYTLVVERMSAWLRRSRVRRAVDGLLGAVLVGLGLRVGSESLASS